MKDWPPLTPDDELERADYLLEQADALLRRHDTSAHADLPAAGQHIVEVLDEGYPAFGTRLDNEDLPILTEVVEDPGLPEDGALPAAKSASHVPRPTAPAAPAKMPASGTSAHPSPGASPSTTEISLEDRIHYQLAERLVELDTQIARGITEWMEKTFPQFLQRELGRLSEQLQAEMKAHLRATLLPEISSRISEQMVIASDTDSSHTKR